MKIFLTRLAKTLNLGDKAKNFTIEVGNLFFKKFGNFLLLHLEVMDRKSCNKVLPKINDGLYDIQVLKLNSGLGEVT